MVLASVSSLLETAELADILSVIALLITLIVAYMSYRLSKKVAEGQAKPILAIYTAEYINRKALTLVNVGVGTAILTSVKMRKGNKQTQCAAELFDLKTDFKWDTFWRFQQTQDYLQAGEKRRLAQLSLDNLLAQGISEKQSHELLEYWQKELEGIQIEISYEDVFGNAQPKYARAFHS